jgi:WD40 repeat protein
MRGWYSGRSPPARHTLVGRKDGQVYWLGGRGAPAAIWQPLKSFVTALALSSDESRAVVASESGEVVLLSLPGGAATRIPAAHRDAVRSAAFGPGGWAVTGSADGTVKIWSPAGTPVLTLWASGPVRQVAVSDDGALLTVLVDGERAVRRWRLDKLRAELAALGLGWDG